LTLRNEVVQRTRPGPTGNGPTSLPPSIRVPCAFSPANTARQRRCHASCCVRGRLWTAPLCSARSISLGSVQEQRRRSGRRGRSFAPHPLTPRQSRRGEGPRWVRRSRRRRRGCWIGCASDCGSCTGVRARSARTSIGFAASSCSTGSGIQPSSGVRRSPPS
jgi:hypothetical protein